MKTILVLILAVFLVSCDKGRIKIKESSTSAPKSSSSDFIEQGLRFIIFNPEDSGSIWTFDSEGEPLEKILDSSLIPTNNGVVSVMKDFDTFLFFFKVKSGTEYHLYKLVISEKSFEKIKEFDSAANDPRILSSDLLPADDGVVLFSASDSVHGNELWKTDGTSEGTVLVKDIFPGTDSGLGTHTDTILFNGAWYFSAQNSTNDFELWRTDGTTAGTYEVSNINPDTHQSPHSLKQVGDHLLFNFQGNLWQMDASEVVSGPGPQVFFSDNYPVINNKVVIDYFDSEDSANKIGVYDPTTSSFVNLTAATVAGADGNNAVLGIAGDKILFLKRDTGNVYLYSTQGSDATTELIGSIVDDGSAEQMYSTGLAYFPKSATTLITLDHTKDHTNNSARDPQIYKIEDSGVTNFTDDVLDALNVSWTNYELLFLSTTAIFGSDAPMSIYDNGEYKVMVMDNDTGYTKLAKTSDLENYTIYEDIDPSLIATPMDQLKYYMAALYGKFYYGYAQFQYQGETHYFNNYYFPVFN